ncbi:Phage integrase, N-terminal SAM-like domain [Mariprofundus ferrinatatus]|uniref:Phage integrase, N-terminal SAM-like domain n=1 Tax=Mariprofundus ferrinatatus TaxID=1921087 RepID=A0A2K8L5I6_9PROT|nr:site-specific integrase [Mariprofundus ferrinatatus]ATX82580.1 Phage integrase, N-terminal SAM-like domain [Mariprofundus ferrinatatus]
MAVEYLQKNKYFVFYYRRVVPEDLRPIIRKREIKKSLRTRERSLAILRHNALNIEVEKYFRELRGKGKMADSFDPLRDMKIKQDAIATHIAQGDAVLSGVVNALRGRLLYFSDPAKPIPAVPIEVKGAELFRVGASEPIPQITIATALAHADAAGIQAMIDETSFIGDASVQVSWEDPENADEFDAIQERLLTDKLKRLGLFEDAKMLQEIKNKKTPQVPSSDSQATKLLNNTMTFSELAEEYLATRPDIKPETLKLCKSVYALFIEIMGDIKVSSITHKTITDFLSTLKNKMPANARKKYPNLSISEILEQDHEKNGVPLLAIKTINKYNSTISPMFNYAVNNDLMDKNYTENKTLRSSKTEENEKEPFTQQEVQKIFCEMDVWVKNDRSKPENFWIMLIGAFTGARLGEICQLKIDDVKHIAQDDSSGWVFDINELDDKEVKRTSAIRMVPIHSELVKLGFLDYVEERKKKGSNQVFDLNRGPNGSWSYYMSKRYGYRFRKGRFGKSFHNWRHTVCDMLMKNPGVLSEEQDALVGHKLSGEGRTTYGKGFGYITLKKTVEAIKYDVDLSHLYTK